MLLVRPSLRHLKAEVRRRAKSRRVPALYEAQLAIAREHGQPSWAALKKLVCGQSQPQSRALSQLRWIISRFAGADDPGWAAPDDQELRLHFHDEFLTRIDAGRLVETIAGMAADLREEYVVTATSPLTAQVQVAGWQVPRGRRRQPPAPAERREPASPGPPHHRPSCCGAGDAYLRRGARGGEPGRRVRSRAGYG